MSEVRYASATIDGKSYSIVFRDWSSAPVEIFVSWERIVPRTACLARPSYNTATRSVSPFSRTGQKVLTHLASEGHAIPSFYFGV